MPIPKLDLDELEVDLCSLLIEHASRLLSVVDRELRDVSWVVRREMERKRFRHSINPIRPDLMRATID